MARLGTPVAPELLRSGSCWRLLASIDGYARSSGSSLATQAGAGRRLEVLQPGATAGGRLRVRLLEDGYPCWLDPADLLGQAVLDAPPRPRLLNRPAIAGRLPAVLGFAERAAGVPNRYLWGGCTGPNYDCSGFVQSAFASAGIWIPRDAYQQERFTQPVAVRADTFCLLKPGDLIFFGSPRRCTHVGLHLGDGRYWHSSGREHGRNGLGLDQLCPHDDHPVARHYRAELRGAGRVMRCHDGTTLA